MPGGNVLFPTTSFQIRLAAIGGTGISINNAVLVSCYPGTTTVLTSTNITFNGGSLPYAVAFSGASDTNPFYLTSDVIAAAIDQEHDWYFYVYLDSDGTSYNTNLVLYGAPGPSGSSIFCTGLYVNHSAGNTVPAVSGSVGAITNNGVPLIMSVLSG